MQIYLYLNEQQVGPYTSEQIQQFLDEGQITNETPAWYEGLADWNTVSDVLASNLPLPIPPSPMTEVSSMVPQVGAQAVVSGAVTETKPKSNDLSLTPTSKTRIGMKWYKWWVYGNIPLTIILNLMALSLLEPMSATINVLVCIVAASTAIGLHQMKVWAWRLNWLVIVSAYLLKLKSIILRERVGTWLKSDDEITQLAVMWIVFGALVWLLPNFIYWRKRRHLFKE